SHRSSDLHARDHLESLITKHGHPTPVSLSSLRDLTATSSTYNPPSPLSRPTSPVSDTIDSLETLSLSSSTTRPIPIPKRSSSSHEDDLPVTPLTGRFDKGDYFPHRDHRRTPADRKPEISRHKKAHSRHGPHSSHSKRSSRMRAESSTFYSPVSPAMSPSGRPSSPQPSRTQNTTKSVPSFHLGSLPRYHPAVYQQQSSSQGFTAQQPPSPRQTRQHTYRTSSSSRENSMWQYRELVESVTRTPTGSLGQSPSAPRLDPLRSPGPVTPLTLEEASGYLAGGANNSDPSSRDTAAAPDLVERLLARENERARQKSRMTAKGR
ncbi:hypothetical protein ASPWEDRAFT_114055, partial [Aspergillus wentii DTO 134E9]